MSGHALTLVIPATLPDALAMHPLAAIEGTLAGPALSAIVAARIDQLAIGHTPEADRDDTSWRTLKLAREWIAMAHDLAFAAPERRDYPKAMRLAAKVGALCMAAHDRMAFEIEAERQTALYAEALGETPGAGDEDLAAPTLALGEPAENELIFDADQQEDAG